MKLFGGRKIPELPRETSSLLCVIINQIATPGLGSIMKGHKIAGAGQLTLALAGFVMVLVWYFKLFEAQLEAASGPLPDLQPVHWWGKVGGSIFLAAWLWSWVTSIQILIDLRKSTPPRIV